MSQTPETGNGVEGSPEGYPHEWVEKVTLRDGTEVTLRPIRPDDAPRLQEGFLRLSPQSIYLRFLETVKELPDSQAEDFSTLDYQNRMALVAEILEHGEEHLIGVARYALTGDPNEGLAESAVVVVDEYQGRGLGTILLDRLIRYAWSRGLRAFLATVHHTNAQMMRFIQRSGFRTEKRIMEPGVWEVRIDLNSRYRKVD